MSALVVASQEGPVTNLGQILSDTIGAMTIPILAIGVIMVFFGIAKGFSDMTQGRPSNGWSIAGIGGAFAAAPLLLKVLLPTEEPISDDPTPSSAPTSNPASTAAPEPSHSPAPLPDVGPALVWIGVGLGALLALALVVFLIVAAYKRASRSIEKDRSDKELLAARREEILARWEKSKRLHDETLREYLKSETDWDMLFNLPTLTDPTVKETGEMIRALNKAGSISSKPPVPRTITIDTEFSDYEYPKAVEAFWVAWKVALAEARKTGQKRLSAEERKAVNEIRQLLKIAENPGASEHERAVAYRRVRALSKKLDSIAIPEKAFTAIEQKQRLMIAASRTP